MSIKATIRALLFVSLISPTLSDAETTVYIDQVGNTNDITITQQTSSATASVQLYGGGNKVTMSQGGNGDSGGHSASLYLNGIDNIFNSSQMNLGDLNSGHILNATILGNANRITSVQHDASTKTQTLSIIGNNNMISATQQNTGYHSLSVTLNGNGNNVTSTQSGSGSHSATIELTNGGGPSSLDLSQSGATNKSYSLSQICFNLSGCSASVSQH